MMKMNLFFLFLIKTNKKGNNMSFLKNKKRLSIILGIIILVSGFLLNSLLSSAKDKDKDVYNKASKIKVITTKIENKNIEQSFEISGHIKAYEKIEIYSEVTGIAKFGEKAFREGNYFEKEKTIFSIDDEVFRNNLNAQRSNFVNALVQILPDLRIDFPNNAGLWEDYLKKLSVEKLILPLPEVKSEKEKFYLAAKNIYNLYYNIKSLEATLEKYKIKAPFNGVVTESIVTEGSLVRVGQKIGEFINSNRFEVEANVNLYQLKYIKEGMPVSLYSSEYDVNFNGRLERINKKIDKNTQTVKVYINVSDSRLKDGMFLSARITSKKFDKVVSLPKESILSNQSVYIVDIEKTIQKINVDIKYDDGNKVLVSGLPDGAEVITSSIENFKVGMKLN